MSFRLRVLLLSCLIVVLAGAFVLGIVFSPDRVQARTEGRSLLSLPSTADVTGFDIFNGPTLVASLKKQGSAWQVSAGDVSYPGSASRIGLFLRMAAGLSRGTPVTSDTGHFAELGVSGTEARRLLIHRADGRPDIAMSVGRRGPSGDEDYVLLDGERTVRLVRGSLAFYLGQGPSSWYELHVLPDDVTGDTVATVSIRGRLTTDGTVQGTIDGPYTLVRGRSKQEPGWSIEAEKRPVNGPVAAAMVSALALLEGVDFTADSLPKAGAADGTLFCDITTLAGKAYSLVIRPGDKPGMLRITTSWSSWTYRVSSLSLRRAILPRGALLLNQ